MINSEHDLWQLFGGEGPDVPGEQERIFNELHDLTTVLDVGQKQRNRPYRPSVQGDRSDTVLQAPLPRC